VTVALLMLLVAAAPPPASWGLENFERQSLGPGWAGWDAPFGPAARHATVAVVTGDRGRLGQVTYQGAQDYLVLPGPELDLDQRPLALTLRVQCEGATPALGVTLIDAAGEWLQAPSRPLESGPWQTVRLPLDRFVDQASGDLDGQLDLPVQAFNLNLSFTAPVDGTLRIDDLALQTEPVPSTAFLDLHLAHPERAGACVLGDEPPAIAILNRGRSTARLHVVCRLGDASSTTTLAPAPQQTVMVPLTPVRTGPQLLEVVAQADDGEQRQSFVLTVLPRRLGGPDTFYGLGCYDSADLVSGRFGMELGLLRVAGADWTLFWLAGRPTEPTAAGTDPLRFAEAMTLAWAQQLRTVAYVAAPSAGRFAGDLPGYLTALEASFGEDPKGYLVPANETGQLALLRSALAHGKLLWGWLGAGVQPPDVSLDGWLAPLPALSAAPESLPGPTAWARLQATVAPLGPGPLQIWSRSWPAEQLTGLTDRGAAQAILMACLRATPGVRGACFGQVLDGQGVTGLTGAGQLRPELVAYAVASRLCGGLPCRGLVSPAPGAYAVVYGTDSVRCAVAWTEAEPAALTLRPGCQVYDHLGNALPWSATQRLHREPVYIVGAPPLSDELP